MTLEETLKKINPIDETSMTKAKEHWDSIAHPLHSLGKLEDVVVQIAGIQRTPVIDIQKKSLVVMCADNGVVEEGVTQTGQEVTAQVSENFTQERATAAIFCRMTGADILPIDIGIYRDTKIRNCKIAYGTKNFAKEPAMTRDEAIRAIEVGINIAEEQKNAGYRILATGEMGIGNTTTSSAIASCLLGRSVEEMTGRGAGLSTPALEKKIQTIKNAFELHHPNPEDPIDVLSKVGGFDIAGMAGLFLGGAALGLPVVIDGFISAVAALVAQRICPTAAEYMIASHMSKEPAAEALMKALGKEVFITADMCLGEGSGAVSLFPMLDLAREVYVKMATFTDTDIDAYVPLS